MLGPVVSQGSVHGAQFAEEACVGDLHVGPEHVGDGGVDSTEHAC